MVLLVLCSLQVLLVAVWSAEPRRLHVIDSHPLYFVDEPETESHVINSTLILKKKGYTLGPVYYNSKKPEIINNHHNGGFWKRPPLPISSIYSNHKGQKGDSSPWKQKWENIMSTTAASLPNNEHEFGVINNHKSNKHFGRPQQPSSVVKIADTTPTQQPITDVLGDRVKHPDIIKSSAVKVLDAPSHLKTTIKHNKIIVIQKRTDKWNNVEDNIQSSITQSNDLQSNFSVAPVMDPWSNIPIPSQPSWTQTGNGISSTPVKGGLSSYPVKGGMSAFPVKGGVSSSPVATPQTVLPNLPFMPFFTSLIAPLLSKPLSPSALNSGMQGIKAMQSFLRNSLMGAMFCFLPSAFIALSLSASQRTELRSSPEVDDLMVFCKKCLENLKEAKNVAEFMQNNRLDDDSG